jgi:mono/diheme cytochrome c family protein
MYRTLVTGLDGTPMPSYGDSIPPADVWHLVHYVRSLVRPRTWWDWLAGP